MQGSGAAGRPELVLENTRLLEGVGGAEGLGVLSGSLPQMGSQGQRVLSFNLSRVFSLTRQPELGIRAGWSPAGLMAMVKWG